MATGSGAAPGQIPPPRPPAADGATASEATRLTPSTCEKHRAWIEVQVGLGCNAVSIYQDLVERYGFTHAYNSMKRFVSKLKARAPERFDVLEFLPGEEAQVDYGQGALTLYRGGRKGEALKLIQPFARTTSIWSWSSPIPWTVSRFESSGC